MNDQWLDKLQQKIEAHEELPPEGLWESIEQSILSAPILPQKKQKRIYLWGKRLTTVAAAILAVLFIGHQYLKEAPIGEVVQKIQNKYVLKKNTSETLIEKKELLAETKETTIYSDKKDIETATILNAEESSTINTENILTNTKEEPENVEIKDTKKERELETDRSTLTYKDSKYKNNNNLRSDILPIEKKDRLTKWESSIYVSNIPSGTTKMHGGYGSFSPRDKSSETDENDPVTQSGCPSDILFEENKYREIYTDVKHKQPITLGASIHYSLNNKWSITSGLTYTILPSELRSGSGNYYYESKQTLHNIGIPLNLVYNIWNNKNMLVYLSGGGCVEKNVSGKIVTEYFLDNKPETSNTEKISIDKLQWSLNTSLGMQYNISSTVGMYVEPGISYYFENDSETETIYKEKSLNLSLRLGLRFSLNK